MGGPRRDQSILTWGDRTAPSYPARVVRRWRQPSGTGYRDLVAGRRDLSAWCPDNGTEGRHGGQPSTTGDSSTIPAVSRRAGGRPSPTGDVDTVPTEPRASAEWHVDAWISSHNEKPLEYRDRLTPRWPWKRTKKYFSSGRRLSRTLLVAEDCPEHSSWSDTPTHHFAGPRQEGRPAHRPAAPIQRFNSKSIGWPAWFRHFRAVADVQGWDKDQRALQMVSYLDEKTMNVAQELSDRELYNYDALVGLLSARFDPASRVSASRSRFHGRTRRHQEDADTYADSITELCRLGYPQSSPEHHQELISEQFVRGQSDPELKKYLWVVIRTQKDKKLQTLIEVCTDFASLSHTTSVHRPAEQVFALEEEDDREEEMFAVVDRQQWNTQRAAEPPLSPELQQMFALARRMGYEMRPIARCFDAPRQTLGPRSSQDKDYRAPFRPRDYSRTKCFSCGQLGHTQVRCPKPDSSLPFRPSGWVDRSDGPQRSSGGSPQGNEI